MKWTYSIKNKMTAAMLLGAVLAITLLNNLSERRNFKQLEASMASIYKDRLMVESYIFQLYDNLQQKDELLQNIEPTTNLVSTQQSIAKQQQVCNQLLDQYEATYLTEEEEIQFGILKKNIAEINLLENKILHPKTDEASKLNALASVQKVTQSAYQTLSLLSDIQTSEGQSLKDKSTKIVVGTVSTSYLEMAVLIVIALIIQALVFSSKTLKAKMPQRSSLN